MYRPLRTLLVSLLICLPNVLLVQVQAASADAREKLIGTYSFVGFEIRDANGNWIPDPNYTGNGYITYSDDGYMGVQIMPADRKPFANNPPTPAEAQQAIQGYIAYFGPFTMHANEGFVTHHRVGAISPGGAGDTTRFFDFEGNRLILTPPPASGNKEDAARQVIWERMPNVALSAEAQKFIGTHQLMYTDRYAQRNDDLVRHDNRNDSDAGSYIIYTPTGHMMVHLMDKAGRTAYAGNAPTAEEALAAYRSYYGYFGRFTLYESATPPYVVHNQEGLLNPSGPVDTERLFQIGDGVLRLGPRPRLNNGEATGTHLYWQTLPSLK